MDGCIDGCVYEYIKIWQLLIRAVVWGIIIKCIVAGVAD